MLISSLPLSLSFHPLLKHFILFPLSHALHTLKGTLKSNEMRGESSQNAGVAPTGTACSLKRTGGSPSPAGLHCTLRESREMLMLWRQIRLGRAHRVSIHPHQAPYPSHSSSQSQKSAQKNNGRAVTNVVPGLQHSGLSHWFYDSGQVM